jgi:hypothetical protein
MKQNLITITLFALLSMLMISCSKENLMYTEAPAVYFKKSIINPDSVIYSFGIRPNNIITDTVYLALRIMGSATATDREIKFSVAEGSTAKLGYHFAFGPLVMPAGQYETLIPVYLHRKAGLKDSILTARIRVLESKDFKPGYDDVISGSVLSRLEYRIVMNDQILRPSNWTADYQPYFGVYSVVKYRFMIEVTGKTTWNAAMTPGEINDLVGQVKFALYNYQQANGPLLDENGLAVVFP